MSGFGNLLCAASPFCDSKAPAPTNAADFRNSRRPVSPSAGRFRRFVSRAIPPLGLASLIVIVFTFPKYLSPDNIDHVRDVTGKKLSHVLLDHGQSSRGISVVKTRKMRCQDNILRSPKRVIFGKRFLAEYVEGSARNLTAFQCLD